MNAKITKFIQNTTQIYAVLNEKFLGPKSGKKCQISGVDRE